MLTVSMPTHLKEIYSFFYQTSWRDGKIFFSAPHISLNQLLHLKSVERIFICVVNDTDVGKKQQGEILLHKVHKFIHPCFELQTSLFYISSKRM